MSADDDGADEREPDQLDRLLDHLDGGAPQDRAVPAAPRADRPRRIPGRDRRRDRRDEAQSTLLGSALAGVLALAVGIIVAIAAWPGTEQQNFGSGAVSVDTGSVAGAIIGVILIGVGQLLVLLAIVGYGVMLGIRAAREPG